MIQLPIKKSDWKGNRPNSQENFRHRKSSATNLLPDAENGGRGNFNNIDIASYRAKPVPVPPQFARKFIKPKYNSGSDLNVVDINGAPHWKNLLTRL